MVRGAGEGGTEEGGLLIGRDKLVKLDGEPLSGGREACKEDRRARPPEDGGVEMDMQTESREGHSSSLFDSESICCNMHMSGGLIRLLLPFLTLSSESRLFSGLLCVVVTSLRPTFSTEEACRRTLTPFGKGADEKRDT